VVVFSYDLEEKELRHLFDSVNGLLFTGGEIEDVVYVPLLLLLSSVCVAVMIGWLIEHNNA
jgi:hypothetical protein